MDSYHPGLTVNGTAELFDDGELLISYIENQNLRDLIYSIPAANENSVSVFQLIHVSPMFPLIQRPKKELKEFTKVFWSLENKTGLN